MRSAMAWWVVTGAACAAAGEPAAVPESAVRPFLERHCLSCHAAVTQKGGLRLDELPAGLADPKVFATWVKVHDRVRSGQMPPAGKARPDPAKTAAVMDRLADALHAADEAAQAPTGRVALRRLNRVEYENTLRDLLGLPDLDVKEILPEDGSAHGFDNVAEALNVSYVQMARYLEAADAALDAAMRFGPRPETRTVRVRALDEGRLTGFKKKGGPGETAQVGEAVAFLRQPNSAQAPWRWGRIRPAVDGRYRFRLSAYGICWDKTAIKPADRPHVVSLYAESSQGKRLLGTRDIPNDKPGVMEVTAYMRVGEVMLAEIGTLTDINAPVKDSSAYKGPGVVMEWAEIEGPLPDTWPPASVKRLFGDLPVEEWTPESGLHRPGSDGSGPPPVAPKKGKAKKAGPAAKNTPWMVVSAEPIKDAERLLAGFMERAFRRPVEPGEIARYLRLVKARLDAKLCFQDAMRTGYKAVLCSPDFLFFHEKPGPLDDHALACRLSYFLWSSLPDDTLIALAAKGGLNRPEVLRAQVERMLADPKAQRFVENFTGQWLDLRRIAVTEPDERLYPEFDALLLQSMTAETHAFFGEMLKRDLGAAHVVEADFAMINWRLAELYGIPGVSGMEIRRVQLPPGSVRGGLLTQASVLKVTANGTTTSPVTRGAWVLDRIVGRPAPPPPPNVPAIEPDVRGALTIRDQLAKHRDLPACAGCHSQIDPPGFALEGFDVMGGERTRYRSLEVGDKPPPLRSGKAARFRLGLPVDASGRLPDGRPFDGIAGFKKLLAAEKEQLARNLAERLLVSATGAGVRFSDRRAVEGVLAAARPKDYGLRTLVHEVVQSEPFRRK